MQWLNLKLQPNILVRNIQLEDKEMILNSAWLGRTGLVLQRTSLLLRQSKVRRSSQNTQKNTAFAWCSSQGGQFHRDRCIAMHRTLRKCQNIYACGFISITNRPISITNRMISIKKWPPWLPHMNAKSFCFLLAWAPNLSILTLRQSKFDSCCQQNQFVACCRCIKKFVEKRLTIISAW